MQQQHGRIAAGLATGELIVIDLGELLHMCMLRFCLDLMACICSAVGSGYLLSRLFSFFLTSNKFLVFVYGELGRPWVTNTDNANVHA